VESNWVHSARRPPIGLLYLPRGDFEDGEFGGMMIGSRKRSTRKKPAPVPLCPPQIQHDLMGANPGRRGGKPETNCLNYGTALSILTNISDPNRLSIRQGLWSKFKVV
jgi:hypothetical protein